MPTQNIDLSEVTDATFGGSAVEQINLNGTGVWTMPTTGITFTQSSLLPINYRAIQADGGATYQLVAKNGNLYHGQMHHYGMSARSNLTVDSNMSYNSTPLITSSGMNAYDKTIGFTLSTSHNYGNYTVIVSSRIYTNPSAFTFTEVFTITSPTGDNSQFHQLYNISRTFVFNATTKTFHEPYQSSGTSSIPYFYSGGYGARWVIDANFIVIS